MSKQYDVGYGKPPVHSRWKKGQSGNTKGRPRRASIADMMVAVLDRKVVVTRGRSKRRITKLEQLIGMLFERAAEGDPRLMKLALEEARRHERPAPKPELPKLDPADEDVLKALYARLTRDALEQAGVDPSAIEHKSEE